VPAGERRLTAPDGSWGDERSREVRWHDPALLAGRAAELSGRDFLAAIVEGRLPQPPIAKLLGIDLVSAGDGAAVFRCEADESVYNPIGSVQGGWLCTILDAAAGCAVHTLLPAGVSYSSIEIKASFLKAVRAGGGPIEATGRTLKLGRRVGFAEAHAREASGELVGHATTSVAILRP
jgi:uncharacterized protein (TIGR00369 family)